MNNFAELPLIEPLYGTYPIGVLTASITENPSIRNWFLNNTMILTCNRKFLSGFTTPNIRIENLEFTNPCFSIIKFPMRFLDDYINLIIRRLIDDGYYVYFQGIDDYYVDGKSWFKTRHMKHCGTICGYNQTDKTYCIYAYDVNWRFQKFWTPQASFNKGREAMFEQGEYGYVIGFKPKANEIKFSVETACNGITDYLDSDKEKYPEDGEGKVRGIVVHEYIAKYVGKLLDGSIPYERMDWRVLRLIWEHKKVMLERIMLIEQHLEMDNEISEKYKPLVAEANTIRMLYASHHKKRRDSVLPIIQKKLLWIMNTERELLTTLVERSKKEPANEVVDVSEKKNGA